MPLTHGIIILYCVVLSCRHQSIYLLAIKSNLYVIHAHRAYCTQIKIYGWYIYIYICIFWTLHAPFSFSQWLLFLLFCDGTSIFYRFSYTCMHIFKAIQPANKPFSHHSLTLYIVVSVERVSMIYWRIDDVSVIANILHCNHAATIDHLYVDRPQYAFAK